MVKKLIQISIIVCLGIIFSVPLMLTVVYSFQNDTRVLSAVGYQNLLFQCYSFYTAFWNSVFYSICIAALHIILTVPSAFLFTQSQSPATKFIYMMLMILMMMPLQVTILPTYISLRDFHLLDTRSGIVCSMAFAPMYIIIIKQYMENINMDIVDAVKVESNSVFRVVVTGVLPQIRPCIFAVLLFSLSESWNMLEQPMLILKNEHLMPLTMFINQTAAYDHHMMLAASVLFIVPMLLAYCHFSAYLRHNLILGGIDE